MYVITSLPVWDNFLLNRTRLLFNISSSVRIPVKICISHATSSFTPKNFQNAYVRKKNDLYLTAVKHKL